MRWFSSSWFRRKPIASLIAEMNDGDKLHRNLGPVALTALGMGATIGTGLYVLTGEAAHDFAGPSLVLSFLLAGLGCCFAAMCYSELASMVPVAGSAYTYAYATLGEFVAWVIGWDLILEYAISSCAVASSWTDYFQSLCANTFGIRLDPRLLAAPWDFEPRTGTFLLKTVTLFDGQSANAWVNLPAILVTIVITMILVVGIRESAGFNVAMVCLNLAVIFTFIGIGMAYLDTRNWRPFLHEEKGWAGIPQGAARIFFAYIGFDSISTHAEEAKNPQRDLSIAILASLAICTILYVSVTAVLTGMVPYRQINIQAPLAAALNAKGLSSSGAMISLGILAGMTSAMLVGNLSQARILLAMARDGMLPIRFFGAVHPRFKTPWKSTIAVGLLVAIGGGLAPLGFLADLVSIGTLFAFVVVSASVWILRYVDPNLKRPFRTPWIPLISTMGILINGGLMLSLGRDNWIRLIVWLILGMIIYTSYSRFHSVLNRRGVE